MNLLDVYSPEELQDLLKKAQVDPKVTEAERQAIIYEANRAVLESDYENWLRTLFPKYVTADLAPHLHELWQWIWALRSGVAPPSVFAAWNRGVAKSTSAEMACVAVGARQERRYGLYICETQDQADDHVANIADMLESKEIGRAYPGLSQRKSGKFGNSLGWRRQRLRTASGLTIDALGLDTASRGIKMEDQRPDFMVIDDIDDSDDSPDTVEKKARTLTKKIVPAGSEDLAILWAQNLIHMNSVLSRILDGREDALRRRIVSGPIALEEFDYRIDQDGQYRIKGNPTWGGFDLPRCEELINKIGLDDFEAECQQMVEKVKG